MTIAFNNNAKSQLLEAVGTSDTTMYLPEGAYRNFLEVSGDYVYAVLVNASQKEIVKIDLANSSVHQRLYSGGTESYSGGLMVVRGQGGTSAKVWKRGTLIYQDLTEDGLNSILQKGVFRTVAYDPNGVISPAYFGEKIYQTGRGWWKSTHIANPSWQRITVSGWVSYLDDTYWGIDGFGTWDGVEWDATGYDPGFPFPPIYLLNLKAIGSWATDFRPTKMRIAHNCPTALAVDLVANASGDNTTADYTSGLEVDIIYTGDISYLNCTGGVSPYSITNIEFYIP